MVKSVVSPKFSFKGYKLWIAVKDELKEVLRVGVPLVVTWVATSNPLYAVVGAAVGRLIITGFEYFWKEYN